MWKIFFLFLYENIHCGYSLEAPRRGASNEYPQCMVSLRNKKIINSFFGWGKKKKKCLKKKNALSGTMRAVVGNLSVTPDNGADLFFFLFLNRNVSCKCSMEILHFINPCPAE